MNGAAGQSRQLAEHAAADRAAAAPVRRPGRAGLWATLAAAVVGLGVSTALIALLTWPALGSALAAERASGTQAYDLSTSMSPRGAATVLPAAGWTVQPEASGGVRLHSPDRLLEVVLTAGPAVDAERELAELGDDPLRERLESGLELQHLTDGDRLTAIVSTPEPDGDAVLVSVVAHDPAALDDYRPALSELLESIDIQ